jgi:hypothetical protein
MNTQDFSSAPFAQVRTLADADKLKNRLETARFRMRFKSFAEVVWKHRRARRRCATTLRPLS